MSKITANSSESVGYRALIRSNRNFCLFWLGQIISLLFVVRMLAPFLISPIAGVVADHYNRKYTLIITDLARVVVAFGFLLVRTAADVWLLYVLTALQPDDVEFYKLRITFYDT